MPENRIKTRITLCFAAFAVISFAMACEDSGGPSKSGDADQGSQVFNPQSGCNTTTPTTAGGTGTLPTGGVTAGATTGVATAGVTAGATTATTGGFGLQDNNVTYEKDIKPLLKARCFDSCHNGTDANATSWAGGDGDIDYTIIADQKTFIAQVVESPEDLHKDNAGNLIPFTLSADELAKFLAWRDAGFPRGDEVQDPGPTTGTGTPGAVPGSTTGPATSPCVVSGGQQQVPAGTIGDDVLDELINSELHKRCQAANVMTDRENNTCLDDVPLDMSWCTDEGIKNKFQELTSSGNLIAQKVATMKGQGFTIEGCGVQGGAFPHVSFIKRDNASEQIAFEISKGIPPGG